MDFLKVQSSLKILVFSLLCLSITLQAGAVIDFASLLNEMVDRQENAKWPQPFYTCKQFSSYDRNSTKPDITSWWANWDRSYFLRVEDKDGRKEHVLMDAAGPGAMVRFWATWHGPKGQAFSDGPIRVYFDGSDQPAIDTPLSEFLDGGFLTGAPLSEGVAPQNDYGRRGHNLYLPIPYGKSCKITYETKASIVDGGKDGDALYYQINYRTYDDKALVRTFSMDELKANAKLLKHTQELLQKGPQIPKGKALAINGTIEKDQKLYVETAGSKAIETIELKIEADNTAQALRSVILKIDFDGKQTVWSPIGDFFGTGYQLHPYKTWYARVSQDKTMSCFWLMPFRKEAKITLLNLGSEPVTVSAKAITGDWKWDDRSLYFHASWKQWSDISTRTNPADTENGASDLNWVTILGKGKYVGDSLTIFNGASKWWGEGDEKIYVDGEVFPSHLGTGTEDYYGYAWCRPEPFSSPFHAQPCGDGNLKGGFSVNSRFRSLDAIPFTKTLKFDMELWHWAQTKMDYAPVVFWYADQQSSSNAAQMTQEVKKAVKINIPQKRLTKKIKEAIEGETLKIVECEGGRADVQQGTSFLWSDDKQLWWQHGKPDQSLTLEFTSDNEGAFQCYAGLTKAKDYGIVEIAINDLVLQDELDLFDKNGIAAEITLGWCYLKKGANRIVITIKGANPKAVQSHMFGLDYLKFIVPASQPASIIGTDEITFGSLLEEMINREETARWPSPFYTCRQFSSYSRQAKEPGKEGWWANGDHNYFLRTEETNGRIEHVLMDAKGPGAIVRFWSTWKSLKDQPFSNGMLRVYLDEKSKPALQAPIAEFIDGGYLAKPLLADGCPNEERYDQRGHNLYLPIPYAKHCKITYEANKVPLVPKQGEYLFYQINYRTYVDATPVRTFSLKDLEDYKLSLDKVQFVLKAGLTDAREQFANLNGKLLPGQQLTNEITGGRALTGLEFRLEAKDLPQALRSVILRMEFDGKSTVWSPIGDFFGTGYQIHPYSTWFTKVLDDGTMQCAWVMPYQKAARVTLENLGTQPVDVILGRIISDGRQWDDRCMYFHAGWKQWADIQTNMNPANPENGAYDLNWITVQGRGKYVGDSLAIFNNAPRWWGEGDEKVYVDGESFPSHFGTGTEDYYGYAWARPKSFSSPFHSQPCGAGNKSSIGYSVNNRFRCLDAIPFKQSLQFDMELLHQVNTTVDYAPTVFWYADAGSGSNVELMPQEAQRKVKMAPNKN